MKVGRVNSFSIEGIDRQTAVALSYILCNMDRESINAYLASRGGSADILSKETVKELMSLGQLIIQSDRGGS